MPLAVDLDCANLLCELVGIAVQLLQQCATRTEDQVLSRVAEIGNQLQNLANHLDVDTIALDDTNSVDDLIALAVYRETEGCGLHVEQTRNNLERITTVRTEDDASTRLLDLFLEFSAKQHGFAVDVIAVKHDRNDSARLGVRIENLLQIFALTFRTERTLDAVLSCRHRERCHLAVVVEVRSTDTGDGIRTGEVHQVGHAADLGRFFRADATTTKVVQHERKTRILTTKSRSTRDRINGKFEELLNHLADFIVHRSDRGRIPNRTLHTGFEVGGDPCDFFVFAGHDIQGIGRRNGDTFLDGLDTDRDEAIVFFNNVFPRFAIERLTVRICEIFSFIDHVDRDRSRETLANPHL